MARSTEDDSLEPILPRHPPVAADDVPPTPSAAGEPTPAIDGGGGAGGRSWDRWLLLGCAVVATLALVVCALRLNSIAADQRIEACQVEVYIREQLSADRGRFDPNDDGVRSRLGACVGVTDAGRDGED